MPQLKKHSGLYTALLGGFPQQHKQQQSGFQSGFVREGTD
jgi:hypothetical protein